MKVFRLIALALLASVLGVSFASAQPNWVDANAAPDAIGPIWQLRDGRILAHADQNSTNPSNFYILTPDSHGSYQNGSWTGPYSLQSGYSPFFFSTAVMPDGKTVIVEGGEYNNNHAVWTTLGAVGTLTPFGSISFAANAPPAGWGTIGDAQSVVLANGKYLQANCCTKQTAIFNGPNSWTPAANVLAIRNDESAYTALPNGKVLMVDVQNNANCGSSKSTEYYDPTANTWTCGPQTTVQLWLQNDQELGSAVLTYPNANHAQGSVFQMGGNVVATSVLDIASNTWIAGPTPPNGLDQADGPGALEPNGLVLEQTSPGLFNTGCQFLEYDPVANTLATTVNSPDCPADSSYYGHMMVLPTGQIGSVDYSNTMHLYNPKPGVVAGVAPIIIGSANYVAQGSKNNLLYGLQLNGLTENNAYGDDYQTATNYPLIRFTDGNNNVWYGFTHDDKDHSIAAHAPGFTHYDLNPAMPAGLYKMEVVTNGIASNPINMHVVSSHPSSHQ